MSTLDNWLQTKSRKAAVPKPTTNIDFDEFDDVQLLEALNTAEDECPGFDVESGTRWIYPTNLPVRDYQLEITRTALFNNTLVALPTGLGKTLIAAVVIYNYQRWYPSRKILFMAPTKPLVAQQIDACCNIMCLPASDCCTMTGRSTVVSSYYLYVDVLVSSFWNILSRTIVAISVFVYACSAGIQQWVCFISNHQSIP